jgi:hypothetical protein
MNTGKAINLNKLTTSQKKDLKRRRSKSMLGKNTGPRPEWVKQKMRNNHADYKGENHPRYGQAVLRSSKEKISNSLKRYFKENPSAVRRGKANPMYGNHPTYIAFSPQGEKHIIKEGFCAWCRSRLIDPASARRAALGKQKTAKGWKFQIADQD